MFMERYTLEQVNVGEERTSASGKTYRPLGIKVNGKWYNGFANQDTMSWKAGDTVTIELYQTEKNGKVYDNFCNSQL